MTTTVYEVECLLCGRVAATIVDLHAYRGPSRCPYPHCGGSLRAEPRAELARDLGIVVPRSEPLPARYEHEEPVKGQCRDCGTPTAKAERCRRCWQRRRYATEPSVRARQLRLLKAWRERHKVHQSA